MNKIRNGATVYVNTPWVKGHECNIEGRLPVPDTCDKTIYIVKSKLDGMVYNVKESDIYFTEGEAIRASVEEQKNLVEKYKSEIKSLKDLIEFPLHHCIFGGEEYTEWEAQDAYKARVREITGFELERLFGTYYDLG